jgi:Domain of unknown function (DUF4386)
MDSLKKNARVAGFLYLLLVVVAPVRLMFIPGKLFVHGDAAATAGNIAAHELLFRVGIVATLFTPVITIFGLLALYRLFRGVDKTQAVLMVALGGLIPAPVGFLNAINDAAALILVRGGEFLSVFAEPQRDALALLFLRLHDQEVAAAEILWGLWLFPLAILVLKSRFLPRFLGIWLIANGLAYLVVSLTVLLFPEYGATVSDFAFPALFGEVAFLLWLLIMGAKERPAAAPAS